MGSAGRCLVSKETMDYTRLITWVASAALVVLALLGKAPSYVGMIGLAVSIVNNIVYTKVVLSPRSVGSY